MNTLTICSNEQMSKWAHLWYIQMCNIQTNTHTATPPTMNTLLCWIHCLASLHGLHSRGRVPPGQDTLSRLGWSPCGVEGVAPEEPGELVTMSCLSTDGGGSCNAGAASLLVGKACCPSSGNIVWKLLCVAGGPVFWGVPLMALSLQFQMRRLGPGFNHMMCSSQDWVVWIPYPIRIWFSGRLIDGCCLPDVSLHLFNEYWLSWFQIHSRLGQSAGLSLDELLAYPRAVHSSPNWWGDLWKWSPRSSSDEGF